MTASFRIDSEGGQDIERELGRLTEAFADLEPLMASIGIYLEGATTDRFSEERGPDGQRWKPSLRARQDGGKTLTKSALLRQSITSQASGRRVEVGTNRIYGGIHQFGGNIRAKNGDYLAFSLPGGLGFRRVKEVTMPARPYLGISGEDEFQIEGAIEDHITAALGGKIP